MNEQERARLRIRWLNSKRGGRLTQHDLAERIGTTQSTVSVYLSNGPSALSIARLIGFIFAQRCQELDLDPAAVDAALDTDESHACAA